MKSIFGIAAIVAAGVMATSTVFAAGEKRNDPLPSFAKPMAGARLTINSAGDRVYSITTPMAISAPNVRVAILWDPDDEIIRSKGVSLVRLPSGSTGLYCIRVTSSLATYARSMVPSVTPDFSPGPSGNNLYAYYRSGKCQSNEIGVQTQRNSGGSPINTDLVGFTMTAP